MKMKMKQPVGEWFLLSVFQQVLVWRAVDEEEEEEEGRKKRGRGQTGRGQRAKENYRAEKIKLWLAVWSFHVCS